MKRHTKLSLLILFVTHASPSFAMISNENVDPERESPNNNQLDLLKGGDKVKQKTEVLKTQMNSKQVLYQSEYDDKGSKNKLDAFKTTESTDEKLKLEEMRMKELEVLQKQYEADIVVHDAAAGRILVLEDKTATFKQKISDLEQKIERTQEAITGMGPREDAEVVEWVRADQIRKEQRIMDYETRLRSLKTKLSELQDQSTETKENLGALETEQEVESNRYLTGEEDLTAQEVEIKAKGGTFPERIEKLDNPSAGEKNIPKNAPTNQDIVNQKEIKTLSEKGRGLTVKIPGRKSAFSKFMLSRKGLGVAVAGLVGAVLLTYLFDSELFDGIFGETTPPTQKAAILKGERSTPVLMKDWCGDLAEAALKVEGAGQEKLSESMWNSHVSSLLPIYNRAYEGVARAAITNLSQQTITSWGPAGASFPRDVISVHTTDGDRQKITKQSSQDSALVDFVRTIGLQHRFAQQYADNIQELAFLEMKRATDLSFATDSDHFNKAYTAIFARLAISSECSPYVNEGAAIKAAYKKSRALKVIRDADTEAALQIHFDAKSALP